MSNLFPKRVDNEESGTDHWHKTPKEQKDPYNTPAQISEKHGRDGHFAYATSSPRTNRVIPSFSPHFAMSLPRRALSFGLVEKMA